MLDKCKRFLSLLCAIVIVIGTYGAYLIPIQSIVNAAQNEILDLDDDVKYFGRTFYEYDAYGKKVYKFSWANSGFQFSFKGKGAEITLQGYKYDSSSTVQDPYVKVYINGELATSQNISGATLDQGRIKIEPGQEKKITVTNLKQGNYTIKVVKCTDGYHNGLSLHKIQLLDVDYIKGEILATKKYYDRQMLFIGDSLLAGYGSLAAAGTTTYSTAVEDSTLTFTALAADAFGAENMTIALRDRGIVSNRGGSSTSFKTAHLAKDYFEYLDFFEQFNKRSVQYDHTQYNPDVVVINLGLFDAISEVPAATFKTACKDFILQVKSAYPNAKILYTYGFMDTVKTANSLASTVETVISELNLNGYNDIFYIPLTACSDAEKGYTEGNYGFPTKEAHAARAKELIRAVEDVTDWKSSISVSNPVSDDMPADTIYGPVEDTDVSLMSFNVMEHNVVADQTYLEPSKRAPLVAQMILSYMPDIVCLQEASIIYSITVDGVATNWANYLTDRLHAVGYASCKLTETTTSNTDEGLSPNMDIGNGLIIFWKDNRFECNETGRKRYDSQEGSVSSGRRYLQWVKLTDKQNLGTSFYVYNTHTYAKQNQSVSQTTADKLTEANLKVLATEIEKRSGVPVLIAGDFVKTYDDTEYDYLKNLENMAFIEDAARTAVYTRMVDVTETPAHIFYNKNYIDMREVHEIYEGVEGRTLASQEPIIAHFNFRCPVTFTGGTLSEDKSVFTVETSGNTYNLNFTVGAGAIAKVWYDDLVRGSSDIDNLEGSTAKASGNISLTLENKKVNHFTLRLGYGSSTDDQRVNVVDIYVIRTDVQRPTVTATNTFNCYFANGAYHLLAGNHIVRVSASGGELYMNPYATIPVTNFTMNLKQGRTVLYVKSAATGDVYPVYIYRQTHTQAIEKSSESTIYVDDDFISNGTGKVAFFDGERVIFVDALSAFTTVEAAAAKANADGKLTTIYFGSGNYYVNQNYGSTPVKFTDDVILLGSNYDISAVDEQANQWFAAGRKSESIIHGGFYFEKNGNISVAVKGFKFQGQSGDGTIRINDLSSDLKTVMTHTQTVDIQNNIFMGSIDITNKETGRGQIWANSQAKLTGIIKDNYFRCLQNNQQLHKISAGNTNYRYFVRATYLFNLHDLLIERNFFLGYEICLYTQDVKQTADLTSSTSYTVFSNRFDHCGANLNYLYGVGENDKTYICYRSNDFVRCGSGGDSVKHSIDLYFNESSQGNLPGKVFGNITVDITGNRFAENEHALRFTRGKFEEKDFKEQPVLKEFKYYDYTDMVFNFTKNAIINPLERHYVKGYFYSIDIAGYPKVDASNQIVSGTVAAKSDKWDFSSNYCYSPFFDSDSDYWESVSDTDTDELKLYQYGLYDVRKYIRATRVTFADEIIKSNIHAYTTAAEAFKGAVGSYEDGWIYDFDHVSLPDTFDKAAKLGYEYDYIADIADMDFLRGVTSLRDKMTALDPLPIKESPYDELKKTAYHSMLTTEHLTGEMRGQTSFYSDVRWYCRNRVSFDIRTTYTGDEATFFYKYSNGAMPTGDTYANISNEMFYTINSDGRSSSVNGILLKFKTVNEVATIEMHVSGKSGWKEVSFAGIVDDLTEFIHIDIIEKQIGTMDFYVDGIHFARVVGVADEEYSFTSGAIANTTNTADNAYYDTVNVYRVTNDVISTTADATVINSLVAKQTAIAFSSAHKAAADTANKLWPTKLSMEIDVLEVVDLGVGRLTIINHVAENILYKAWNMTDCHYDEETKMYTYTVNEEWEDFFTSEQYREVTSKVFGTESLEDGKILLTLDRGENNNPVEHDNEFMVALSKAAVAYALEKGIAPIGVAKSKFKENDPNIPGRKLYEAVIKPIDGPGYYVVNSTLGSLITTDTYDNKDGTYNLTVYDKNDPPMLEKYVQEDSDQIWKKFHDASIGETVKFKLLVTVQDGAYGYTIRDLYGEHFDYIEVTSVKQYSSYDPASNSNPLVYVNNTHYVVKNDVSNRKLTIKFASSSDGENAVGSLENVPSGNVIEVIYTAKVRPSAPSDQAIQTSATLSYGRIDNDENLNAELRVTEQFVTEETIVNTYLWSVNLFKYAEDEGNQTPLSGAVFALCTDQAGNNKLSFIGSKGEYRLAASGEAGATTGLKDDGQGNYTIKGLDSGSYYVLELESPDGYARMSSIEEIRVEVQNEGSGLTRVNTYTYDTNGDKSNDAFAFVNKPGFSLPSTGAAGRRLFIATGSVLVLSMSILLVTRMRSSKLVFIKTKVKFKK